MKFERIGFDRDKKALYLYGDLKELLELGRSIEPNTEYDIKVTKTKEKRSLDANGYAWVLIQKLAKALGITPIEVYQQQVVHMYTYTDELIREDVFDRCKKEWEKDHVGRVYEKIGESPQHDGYIWARRHRGSSDFDTREMTHFIDLLCVECQEFGIETKTPEELEKLKKEWK